METKVSLFRLKQVKPLSNLLQTHTLSHLVNKETAEISKKRKYDDSYLSYGFTWTGNEERPNGLCVEFGTVISNTSLFSTKLKWHLQKKTL